MGFFEFLGHSDLSTLYRFGFLDILFATGIFGMTTLLMGVAAFVTAFYGIFVKPKPLAPILLGVLALALGVGAAYIGYSTAAARVRAMGGWSTIAHEELVDAASLCIVTVYMGSAGLLLGFLGSMGNVVAAELGKRKGKEGQE